MHPERRPDLRKLLEKEKGDAVTIGGKKYQVISFPDSFFRATRKLAEMGYQETSIKSAPMMPSNDE